MQLSVSLGVIAVCAAGCGVIPTHLGPRARRGAPDSRRGAPDSRRGAPDSNAAAGRAVDEQLAALTDDGVTSDLHRKFLGQIVFATTQIPKDDADENALGAEFYADELLYGRAYFTHSVENEAVYEDSSSKPQRTETRGYVVKLFVDGAERGELASGAVPETRRTSTTLQVWPRPATSDDVTPRAWVETINALSAGDHRIRLEVWAHDRWRRSRSALATGEFLLHKVPGTRLGTGRTFADLDHGMVDAALSRELVGVARWFANKQGWKETMTDVALRSPQWIDVRHPTLHHVVARRLQAWVRAEWPDGHCTAQEMMFEQKVRRGRPDGGILVGSSGDQVLLDCHATTMATSDPWNGRARLRPTPSATAVAIPERAPARPVVVARKTVATRASETPREPAKEESSVAPASESESIRIRAASPRPVERHDARPGRFLLGVGVAANTLAFDGVATYANLGVRVSRLELGLGATWPFNALGYLRIAVVDGRFELAPMVSMSVLAESQMRTEIAVSGGLSFGYLFVTGRRSAGLRIDALASYNPDSAGIAVPVIGSTYMRF